MPEIKQPVVQFMNTAQIFARSNSPHAPELFTIFSKLQDFVSSISKRMRTIESALGIVGTGGSTIAPGGGITAKEFTLTANLVLPHPTEAVGSFLLYIYIMNATGGWTITYPTAFKGFIQPDPTPNAYSMMLAYKRSETIILPAAGFVPGIDVS